MSMAYYIASNVELPLGSTAKYTIEKNTKIVRISNDEGIESKEDIRKSANIENLVDDEIQIFSSSNDLAGIFVEDIGIMRKDTLKKHFKNSFIYEVSPSWGKFSLSERMKDYNIELYENCKKCIVELFKYIEENISDDHVIEIYGCFIDEEHKKRNKKFDKIIELDKFKLADVFNIEDKQYIVVKK